MEPCSVLRRLWNTVMRLLKLHRSMPASGSSKMDSREWRKSTVAISMRLISPPERVALTSRSMYSRAHRPTWLSTSQSLASESVSPAASSKS